MFDTISVGSATLDLFMKSKQFSLVPNVFDGDEGLCLHYGSKLDVDDFFMQSGGGATNTAVGFARLGLRAAVIAEIGKDAAGMVVKQELETAGVDLQFLVQEKSEQTGVSALLIAAEGGRSVVTARGAARMLTPEDIPYAQLMCNWMHLSSIGNLDVVRTLAIHNQRHRQRFSWNPGGAELAWMESGELHPTEVAPTVFCVNAEEMQRLVNAGYERETLGEVVIVTDGSRGGQYFADGKWTSYAPSPVAALQETGAGDAFITGVAAAFLHDRLVDEAVAWGVANAASVVQHMGAKTGLLRREQLIPG